MKNIKSILLSILALSGLLLALVGCVAEVGGDGRGGGGMWYNDGPWFDGPGWGAPRGGRGIEVHPPGFRR
jgi:hypothetical protein